MGVIFSSRKNCYCAFCKSPRKLYRKKNINFTDLVGAALGSGVLMYAIWQEFDPRVLFLFVMFLGIAEVFVQIRWRLTMVCKQCGFDPVLYLKDTAKAAEKVRLRLAQRKNDPASLLAEPLRLPKIQKARIELIQQAEAASQKKGSLVSRQV